MKTSTDSTRTHPFSREHEFEGHDSDDTCIHCTARLYDTFYGGIGCEAGPEGNDPAYFGLALTPDEQAHGITTVDKAIGLGWISPEDPRLRDREWV